MKRAQKISPNLWAIIMIIIIVLFVLISFLIIKIQNDRAWAELMDRQCPQNVTVGEGQVMWCPPLAEVEAGRQGCVYNISDKTFEQVRSGDVC